MQPDTPSPPLAVEEKNLLTPAEAAELLGVTVWTLERWRRQGIGPIYVRLGPLNGGSIRYDRRDIEKHLEDRRVTPVNVVLEQVLDEAPELAETITRHAARWRKEIPVIFDALAIAAEHDPSSIPAIVKAGERGETSFSVRLPDVPGLEEIELVGTLVERESLQRARLYASSRQVPGGRADPWVPALILDIGTCRLLQPSLHTGLKFVEAKNHSLAFRLRRGDPRVFTVSRGSPVPITQEIFGELLEHSKEFRAALGRGDIREIARPAK